MNDALQHLYGTVLSRKAEHKEGSYTCYLFEKGLDKILKKCGEECSEVIIAAKNGEQSRNGARAFRFDVPSHGAYGQRGDHPRRGGG